MEARKAAVLVFLFAVLSSAQGITCPQFFIEYSNKCYLFSQSINLAFGSWQNARDNCQAYTDSTTKYDLLVIDSTSSADEYTFIKNEMDSNGYHEAYIGAYHLSEGFWVWVDGSDLPLSDPLWGCDSPYGTPYDCIVLTNYYESMYPSSTRRLRLIDYNCYYSNYYICEGYETAVMKEEIK